MSADADPLARHCTCFLLRRAARQATRLYDRHLEPSGMTLTQYSLLAALIRSERRQPHLRDLAAWMGMDHSSLTRTLKPMQKAGWITAGPDADDARCVAIAVTELGQTKWAEAKPLWRAAQEEMRHRLGEAEIASLNRRLDEDFTRIAD